MSTAQNKPKPVWHVEVGSGPPFAEQMAEFEGHKHALLEMLCKDKSDSSEQEKLWAGLKRLADFYSWGPNKPRGLSPAKQAERLDHLAIAARKAHGHLHRTIRDKDLGPSFLKGWETTMPVSLDENGLHSAEDVLRLTEGIEALERLLSTAERAARRAANDIRKANGRPKGPAIPRDYVRALAAVYSKGTGLKAGAGEGPFARFVHGFLIAVGRRDIKFISVIEPIKAALS